MIMKEKIKAVVREIGADDVGFAAVDAYRSSRSPQIKSILPSAKTLVVLAFKELSHLESDNKNIAAGGRLISKGFTDSCVYRLGRFLEREYGARAVMVTASTPVDMNTTTKGLVAEVSLRHAAIAAGLGSFGRHNLIIHPKLGSRVLFNAVITDLELSADPPFVEKLCTDCGKCVSNCPGGALVEEGKTLASECLRNSQPHNLGGFMRFLNELLSSNSDEQRQITKDVRLWKLYQALASGAQRE